MLTNLISKCSESKSIFISRDERAQCRDKINLHGDSATLSQTSHVLTNIWDRQMSCRVISSQNFIYSIFAPFSTLFISGWNNSISHFLTNFIERSLRQQKLLLSLVSLRFSDATYQLSLTRVMNLTVNFMITAKTASFTHAHNFTLKKEAKIPRTNIKHQ